MFAARCAACGGPSALAQALARKRAAGRPLIDLTEANPTRVGLCFPPTVLAAAWAAAAAQPYTPDARGSSAARRAIAAYYAARGVLLAPRRLLLTPGTSDGYAALFKLLGDPGDEVLIPQPGYPLLAYLAAFEGLRPVFYPQRYNAAQGWRIDGEVLAALITPRTRAIVAVAPNNPTGAYLKAAELTLLDALCRRHAMALIVDEVFSDYPFDTAAPAARDPLTGRGCLTFVLNGFSKLLALPQVKLAWIAVGGPPALSAAACARLETVLDFYLGVATPVQHAAAALLAQRPLIQAQVAGRLAQNRAALARRAAHTAAWRLLATEGGWYAIVEIRDRLDDQTRALNLLERADTLIHPGRLYEFNQEGYVVLSLLPRPADFDAGLRRLAALDGPSAGWE